MLSGKLEEEKQGKKHGKKALEEINTAGHKQVVTFFSGGNPKKRNLVLNFLVVHYHNSNCNNLIVISELR